MRKLALAILAMAFMAPLSAEAQKKPKKEKPAKAAQSELPKGPHSDFTFVSASALPDTAADSTATIDPEEVYVSDSGTTTVHVTEGDAFAVTDNDGTDGEASITVMSGSYQVYARATGKPGSSFTINDSSFSRSKGKPTWQDATSATAVGDWKVSGNGNLRYYQSQ